MAVKSAADIVAEMVAALRVSDPELDTQIGSVIRKVFDVVAEQLGPAYAVAYRDEFVYSVDSKSGSDLDDFCATFGIYRLAAKRAVGKVSFFRPTPATEDIIIPGGVQLTTGTGNVRPIFATVSPAVMARGTSLVTVSVQAITGGTNGNLPAGSLIVVLTGVSGVSSVSTQADACYGGYDAESDDSLRERFKKTIFRSLAGTEDMFLALALADPNSLTDGTTSATQANVIGASKRWREQVQVVDVGGGVLKAISTIPADSIKYIYNSSDVFGASIDEGDILTPGVHYDFDGTIYPPEVTGIGTNLIENSLYDLDFEYVPAASRNDPTNGITNRVDIWVAGVTPQEATETTYWQPQVFSADPDDDYWIGKFLRQDQPAISQTPVDGNAFLQLAWGPIIDFPTLLTIGGVPLTKGTNFWVVHQDDGFGYAPRSKFGLEVDATAAAGIIPNAQVLLSGANAYEFNRLPLDIQQRAEKWKLVTTDVQAHAAKAVRLILNFAIMYNASYDRGAVQTTVENSLATFLNSLSFRSTVQVSDILQVAHNVAGVDNIRFTNSLEPILDTDAESWGIQKVTSDGDHLDHIADGGTPSRVIDLVLAENEVAELYAIRFSPRAQNTWAEAV